MNLVPLLALSVLAASAPLPRAPVHGVPPPPPPPPTWNGPSDGPVGPAATGPSRGLSPASPRPAPATSPAVPGAPASGGAGPGTGGGWDGGQTSWSLWWHFNKEPYLDLKSHVHAGGAETGSDGWFLGQGLAWSGRDSLRPTEEQVRGKIVPALLKALGSETNNDIVTSCLIALAKIGDAGSGNESLAPAIERFLAHGNQEIAETAAVALGILANPDSVEDLAALLQDTPRGRELVGQGEVNYRTRAFAAYGLGLVGARSADELVRERIVVLLHQALRTDDTASADLKVGCIQAIGLVPLAPLSRLAQFDCLTGLLQDEELEPLVRAHCPTALARLFPGLPGELHASHRQELASELMQLATSSAEPAELVQSSVQALGLLGTNDGADPLDVRIRAVLGGQFRDQQARRFALISLAKVGARAGATEAGAGVQEAAEHLLEQLAGGQSELRAWAGLSCGILARGLSDAGFSLPAVPTLQQAVRLALEEERDPSTRGALALSCGIMGAAEAGPLLLELLEEERQDEVRGHVAIALGLLQIPEALSKVQRLVDDSRYRPELLRQVAIALGLLGDKDAVPELVELLADARGLATQASISSALGFIGDRRSIDPLVALLGNAELTDRARAFAAVALGIVADKEPLPWNSKLALDVDYRAATPTLTDPASGTGILDIL